MKAISGRRGEPPDFAPKTSTPLLITDSKGKTLENTLRKFSPQTSLPFLLWEQVSAGTEKLVDYVENEIGGAVRQYGPLQIYFWAGTCDVTKKVGNKIELRYKDNQNQSLQVVGEQFNRLQTIVQGYPEVTLKFVEIPFIIISKRNGESDPESLLADQRAENQVDSINLLIRQLNRNNTVNTLHFSSDCSKFRKSKGGPLRRSAIKVTLQDGVHPSHHTSLIWIRKLYTSRKQWEKPKGKFQKG